MTKTSRLHALAAGLALAVAACTPSAPAPAPPASPEPATAVASPPPIASAPIPAPRAISLPADDGPHQALTEWWYYNGHLTGEAGQRYGFELVIFKREAQGARPGYAAHVAVTDHSRQKFEFGEELSLPPPAPQQPGAFDFTVGKIGARGGGGQDHVRGETRDYALDLQLVETRPAAVHGDTGYVGVGAGQLSYYYSRTRMKASGLLRDHGTPVSVSGEAWMDHQWGDFSLDGGGAWDWFSVQLEDGRDLMVSVVRGPGQEVLLEYGTLVENGGTAVHLPADKVEARSTGRWTSGATGITYPMGWTLEVPAEGIDLRLEPVFPQQEMVTTASVDAVYWEGEVLVTGRSRGMPVRGQGYVELTGYGPGSVGGAH